jgi:UDP-4-amino-4,6-dideoxy-N-acetyl-beta-L-altrosamine N-acetyltransferase
MIISKYGIRLTRLTETDLELVRKWRNDEEIKKFMNFREYITLEMQQKWYESINNQDNFYYVIEYLGDKIGIVNDKNIDWKEKSAEGGLFIWDKRYINSVIPLKISMLMLELAYTLLGWNNTIVKVRKDNPRALKYNETLGYVICEEESEEDNYLLKLERSRFYEIFPKINRLISPNSENDKIELIFEPIDSKNGTLQAVQKIIDSAPNESDRTRININYSGLL